MVSKCANPDCSAVFRYLREGRLFNFEVTKSNPLRVAGVHIARSYEHFWLCPSCSVSMTLVKDNGSVAVRPLAKSAAKAGVAGHGSTGRKVA